MKKRKVNCEFVSVYEQFLDANNNIRSAKDYFQQELYLTEAGTRYLRAFWLRHIGVFPPKAK